MSRNRWIRPAMSVALLAVAVVCVAPRPTPFQLFLVAICGVICGMTIQIGIDWNHTR